jgi:hypothetical protein
MSMEVLLKLGWFQLSKLQLPQPLVWHSRMKKLNLSFGLDPKISIVDQIFP